MRQGLLTSDKGKPGIVETRHKQASVTQGIKDESLCLITYTFFEMSGKRSSEEGMEGIEVDI